MFRTNKPVWWSFCNRQVPAAILFGILSWLGTSCQQAEIPKEDLIDTLVLDAIGSTGLNRSALSVPRLDKPVSTRARFVLVDYLMHDPLQMASLSRDLIRMDKDRNMVDQLEGIMRLLDLAPEARSSRDNGRNMHAGEPLQGETHEKYAASDMPSLVQEIVVRINHLRSGIPASQWPSPDRQETLREDLEQLIITDTDRIRDRLVRPGQYLEGGGEFDMAKVAADLVSLARYLETLLPELERKAGQYPSGVWETPHGRVMLAGSSDDHHSGSYLLLIDPGGNDSYENLNPVREAGAFSIVIDLSGDDNISWDTSPGPGSGVLGLGIWIDTAGEDHYEGRNLGVGAGVFGAGLLWDRSGDDVYLSGSLGQGAGQYGIGILIDESGNDNYVAEAAAQGFGAPGGYGIHIDMEGDDHYECKEVIPDPVVERNRRHGSVHFHSLCQGYGFGMRPVISGGVGLLLDRAGNDRYEADMFAQGSATWFGFGMLTDAMGSDSYHAYEHCQGESLHAGAGFLGDWSGNDRYQAYEHCQGTGVDGSVGFLVDAGGNDEYYADRESQGAGVKPFGVGLFVDLGGNDLYEAISSSQGISVLSRNFSSSMQPLGVMLDVGGKDRYRYPGHEPPSIDGRIQNRLGLAINR